MKTITKIMSKDHAQCDDLFVKVEELVYKQSWGQATACFNDFLKTIERHFHIEEEILFHELEQMENSTNGPTEMMRSEHAQMRDLFIRMTLALEDKNLDDYLGHSETLLIIMQQHNTKEEQILYPMIDRVLDADVDRVINAIEAP